MTLYSVHRWYMPGDGRYSRTDPVRLGRALESYLYGGARPTMLFDPLGHHSYVEIVPDDRSCGGYDGMAWGFQATGGGRVLPEKTPVFNPRIQCEEIPCIDQRKLIENIVRNMKAPYSYKLV